MSLKFMQDGPAITHNDLPSAEGLRPILEGEATTSLRETVSLRLPPWRPRELTSVQVPR